MPVLLLKPKGQPRLTVKLTKSHYTIGRSDVAAISIPDTKLSKLQCEVYRAAEGFFIKDLNSRNGVKVNGEMIQKAKLVDGDIVLIGTTVCLFEDKSLAEIDVDEIDAEDKDTAFRMTPEPDLEEPASSDEDTKDLGRI